VSGNTATGQGSVFNVGNAEMVSFTNVTFDGNTGILGLGFYPGYCSSAPACSMLTGLHSQHRTPASCISPHAACRNERVWLLCQQHCHYQLHLVSQQCTAGWCYLRHRGVSPCGHGDHISKQSCSGAVSKLWLVGCALRLQVCHAFTRRSAVLHLAGVRLPELMCYVLLQDYGGAVVVGNDVQASFESCQFLGNGRPLCAEQDFTLVCALIAPFDSAVKRAQAEKAVQ
jgi:hypothetical protein